MKKPPQISVTEAARQLELDPSRVRVLCEQGRLNATKVHARLWLIQPPLVVKPPRRPPP